MPDRILVIVHQSSSNPGRIGQILQEMQYALEIRCPAVGTPLPNDLKDYAAVVVFGGPMSANDELPFIHTELAWIPQVLAAGKPFLGVCLGAQLLARALGAEVSRHPQQPVEIGYTPVTPTAAGEPLFSGLSQVFQWHQEGFALPQGAVLLLEGPVFVNQAFCCAPGVYGLQFHPEMTRSMLELWNVKGAEMLNNPGAQPLVTQRVAHQQHRGEVEQWLRRFLAQWLSEDPFQSCPSGEDMLAEPSPEARQTLLQSPHQASA
ncbi:MAG: gamma-glutamyl-gamma-aminobutyrate hydrolase family protein [Cyanobacteria bacterium P01_A01_bin.135]